MRRREHGYSSAAAAMHILYLAHRVPYPPNKGDKIRTFHHVRHLGAAHAVHLVAFADQPEDRQWGDLLRRFCRSVTILPLNRTAALARGGATLLRGGAFSQGFFDGGAMRQAVRGAIAGGSIDVAWASSVALAPFVTSLPVPRIVDLVDVDSEKWREFAGHAGAPLRWVYALEARRLAQGEGRAAAGADRLLLVSDIEADCLRRRLPAAPVSVVSNGVDTEYFTPASGAAGAAQSGIVFVGALDYRPNVDAVLFFLDQVWPALRARLPAATFTAVGHRPSARLQAAARRAGAGVRVAGSVADVRPYLHAAAVFAAPLRFGRGTKNKVLEAMAAGVPVVASRVAVDGLAVRDGSDVLLAETAGEHADALFALLCDAPRRRALAASALDYVRRSHRWVQLLRGLDACLESVVRGAQVK